MKCGHFVSTTVLSFAVVSSLAMGLAVPALADSAKILDKSGAWRSYIYANKAGTVCYTADLPKRSLNAPKHRGDAHVSVTDRTADRSIGVVSIAEGFAYGTGAPVEIDIDGDKFSLFTADGRAWTHDDKAVVQAMLKGRTMLVYGTPPNGGHSVDTYSLDGFAKAYAEIGRACGLK